MKRVFAIAFATCLLTACLDNPTLGNDAGARDDATSDVENNRPILRNLSHDGLVWDTCLLASPILVESNGQPFVLASTLSDGIHAIDPETLDVAWSIELPTLEGHVVNLIATPVEVEGTVFVAYQLVLDGDRQIHRVVAIDLQTRTIDPEFPVVELDAQKPANDGGVVPFSPKNSLSRATLVHGKSDENPDGFIYVSFGNRRDIQPWHGWVFELDVSAWRTGGAAISSVFLTTPESSCGIEGESGSSTRICGGGVWAPSGPVVMQGDTTFDLLVPTGNGQLDLSRNDFANTLMRMGAGLDFDPACDDALCADFDPVNPSEACMASCEDLFIPRLKDGDPMIDPADGRCDGLSFLDCWAKLDYWGGSSPKPVQLQDGSYVFVLPSKDGAVYLIDGDNMGTMLDREVIAATCGTVDDPCSRNWAGMMVTEPALVEVDGVQIALVSTFMSDNTHPAGLVALAIRDDQPNVELEVLWEAPDFESEEAVTRFRDHTTRPIIAEFGGRRVAWVVDVEPFANGVGTLLGVDVTSGQIVYRHALVKQGRRYVKPVIADDKMFLTSCNNSKGPGRLEVVEMTAE